MKIRGEKSLRRVLRKTQMIRKCSLCGLSFRLLHVSNTFNYYCPLIVWQQCRACIQESVSAVVVGWLCFCSGLFDFNRMFTASLCATLLCIWIITTVILFTVENPLLVNMMFTRPAKYFNSFHLSNVTGAGDARGIFQSHPADMPNYNRLGKTTNSSWNRFRIVLKCCIS